MKLAKLSLAAMVVAGLASSSFAADTLADAFKNGKVNGELRAWYWDRDTNEVAATTAAGKGNADIFNAAVILNYVTDSLYGFYFGATAASNYAPFADKEAKQLFSKDEYGSGAVFSELYLGYKIGKTDAKVGRQYISTPLVGGSSSRIVKESFEGATIVNTDLPQTTLVGGYVSKFQGRTTNIAGTNASSTDSDIGEFRKAASTTAGSTKFATGPSIPSEATFDGAYTIGAINKSVTGLTLTAQYALANDVLAKGDIDLYYTEANYLLPLSNFKLGFDVVYRGSKVDDTISSNFDGTYAGARVSIKELAGFGSSFAYGTTSKNDDVIAGFGGGPSTYTGTLMRASGSTLGANTDSLRFDVTYDFSKIGVAGLTAIASYAQAKQDYVAGVFKASEANDLKYTSYAGGVTYDVAALKGLSLALMYETQEKETRPVSGAATTSQDTDEFRFMANYKF
ncbi:OprD family outer membrane porin [Sulfurospirillum sp. 'SP']|nr:OprD family outer membrane porin [Sulfurospirillum sp. 'SP']WNY98131.1 OprD family outer membrane porin [Sulfurospirillum sp. 'SP']